MSENLFRKSSNLGKRFFSSLFIVIVFVTTIFLFRSLFFWLMLTISALMLWEWYMMTNGENTYLVIGLLIIPLPVSSLLYVSNIDNVGWLLLSFFAIIWCVDTVAMFVGKTIGGIKLAPMLSPHKTISGLVGGVAMASILPILLDLIPCYDVTNYLQHSNKILMLQFAFVAFVAQLSDLFISYFKRKFSIKDSGSIIPGHGGVLDRFDSIILTAPMVAFYLYFQIL